MRQGDIFKFWLIGCLMTGAVGLWWFGAYQQR